MRFTTVDETAVAGIDYISSSGELTFAEGMTNKTISVLLLNDDDVESNEQFRVALSDPGNGATITPGQGAATITLTSEDQPPPPPPSPEVLNLYLSTVADFAVPGVEAPHDDADIYHWDEVSFRRELTGLPSDVDGLVFTNADDYCVSFTGKHQSPR